jgi:hypothetical protein
MSVNQPSAPQPARQSAPVETGRYHFRTAAVIWFVAAVIDIIVAADFLFKLFGASTSSAFVKFIYQLGGNILAGPFHGIFPTTAAVGSSYFDPADLVAIVFYILLGWGLITLVKIVTAPKGTKPTVG